MIKVCHMRSTAGFYGAEKVIFNIFSNFNDPCITLSLINLESGSAASEMLRKKIVSINSSMKISTEGFHLSKRYDKQAINLIQLKLSSDGINIVHTHDYKSLFYAVSACKNTNIKILHHMHGYLNNSLTEYLYSLLEKFLLNKVQLVFVASEYLKNKLENSFFVFNQSIRFLANATEISNPLSSPAHTHALPNANQTSNKIYISMIARFTSEKNHLLAIEVSKILMRRNTNFKLNLYGEGPLQNKISELIKQYKLEEYVELHGYCDNISQVYQTTDLLLITSTTEGLPMVLLEAMSNAIPVVSTQVGQIPQVLAQQSCGLLTSFNAKDIADTLFKLLNQPSNIQRLGEKARLQIEKNYSITSQIKKISRVYQKMMQHE